MEEELNLNESDIQEVSEIELQEVNEAELQTEIGYVDYATQLQRTNELLEMILLSLFVLIVFFMLKSCVAKGAWK